MPELPEVEAVKRGLDQSIVGKRVTAIEVMCLRSFGMMI